MTNHERLLDAWGRWARRGSGSLGWSHQTALGRRAEGQLGGNGWDAGRGFDDDSQALAVDRLVASLPRELRRALVLFYVEQDEDSGAACEVDEHKLARARGAFRTAVLAELGE